MAIYFEHKSEVKFLLSGHLFGNVRRNAVFFSIIKADS